MQSLWKNDNELINTIRKLIIIDYHRKISMQAKQSQLNDFEVLAKIGEGAYGKVFKVKRKIDGLIYAIKKVKIDILKEKERQNALNQIRIMASYNGDNDFIIGFKDAFYDQNTKCLCIVMENAQKGDLLKRNQQHIKNKTKYDESQIWTALINIATGLKSLHEKKILHRDLKSANIFITSANQYKLGDLNVSKVLKKDLADTQTGTPYYASPEVWKDQPYGVKSDIWSLGCVLYEMAALKPPFIAHDLKGLYRKVCAGTYDKLPLKYSNQLTQLIYSMISVNPNTRPTAQQILNNQSVKNLMVPKKQNTEQNESSVQNNSLLKTIKCNIKNFKDIGQKLPKSNYLNSESKVYTQMIKQQPQVQFATQRQKGTVKVNHSQVEQREKQLEQKRKLLLAKVLQYEQKLSHRSKEQLAAQKKIINLSDGSLNVVNPKISLIKGQVIPKKQEQQRISSDRIGVGNYHMITNQASSKKLTEKKIIDYKIPIQKGILENKSDVQHVKINNYISAGKNPLPEPKIILEPRLPERQKYSSKHQNKKRVASNYQPIYPSWWG